ncbi:hypothetical protein [Paraburkholderia sp.]|uniref:hypothetical protein n=1 Tax=Paraburkholderia sp. TaxID=1926495 RepID=UPI0025DA928A|nr:hypothetical protein [Paraburkholderia sp.]
MSLLGDVEEVSAANPFSLYLKLAIVAIVVLAIAAFAGFIYSKGHTAGMAEVQDKWDKQTAAVSQAQTATIAAAASDALANYHAAGVVSAAADQHQADVATVHDQLTKRVQDYAKNAPVSVQRNGDADVAGSGSAADAVLSADGLRIWNDANAGIGNSGGQTPDDSPVAAGGVPGNTSGGK